ncbi:structural maintenance of chromosome 2 [Nematocida sp. LUAm3]|nr:structural maintenance of chromosome 2 [Nematocida sp. LUAm3]KAI5173769.1 structural maintenance of chromosome 2 [Nematocida sp. LUAm2]KAI5176992.1 structural maintenance of chromosome 2 [Nematocida sp. LUAm1]
MHLKEIELERFKSYEKTKISGLDRRFTAITGLNGTGKSNILDGICFVLGIDSPRMLRSASIKDLLFKGGKGGGEGKVTLVFDNKEKDKSPLGYEAMETISITRAVHEDGRTKYLLNGHNITSKSVVKLLLSVGLSSKSTYKEEARKNEKTEPPYFIVMQGRVGRILGAKSSYFLSLLEECAGTSIYRAEKHKGYALLEKKEKKLLETQETLSKTIFPFLDRLRKERKEFYESREAQKKITDLKDQIFLYKASISYAKEEEARKEEKALEKETLQLTEQIEQLLLSKIEQEQVVDEDIIGIQEQIDAKKREVSSHLLDMHIKEEQEVKEEINEEEERRNKLEKKYKKLPLLIPSKEDILSSIGENIKAYSEREKRIRKDLAVEYKPLIEREKEKEKISSKLEAQYKQHREIERKVKEAQAKYQLTEEKAKHILKQYEKDSPQSLPILKKQLQERLAYISYPLMDGVYGKVSELLSVPDEKYAVAVGVVLGGRKEFIVVENEEIGKKVIETVSKQGRRVDVIPINKIVGRSIPLKKEDAARKEGGIPLIEAVEYHPQIKKAVEYLFGGYILSPSRKVSISLRDNESLTSVTVDGELFDRRGTVTGGEIDKKAFSFMVKRTAHAEGDQTTTQATIRQLEKRILLAEKFLEEHSMEEVHAARSLLEEERRREEIERSIKQEELLLKDLSETEQPDEALLEEAVLIQETLSEIYAQSEKVLAHLKEKRDKEAHLKEVIEEKKERVNYLENELNRLEKEKNEGIKRNEVNRARRSIRIREERRIGEEVNLLKKEKIKKETKTDKIKEKIKEILEEREEKKLFTKKKLLSLSLPEMLTTYSEISSSYDSCLRTPHREINPKNIELLEKNEELEEKLKEKINKLKKDKETIQKSIEKLNVKETEAIEELFVSVNKRIGRYVQYFIPNGDAKLVCVDGSPMNGIELHVKMGSWKKGLSELSGGQKSICALSLVFSLLKSRASPLYILDEIDAALDASHTEAMGRMIQKEFEGSQFIVVSLKDGMYHNANALFQTYIREGTSGVRQM